VNRPPAGADAAERARRAVESHPLWYHTMELAPGVVTPGWFDLRPIVDLLPWPDVRGQRCLDVGPWDGHLAFELERRGAREVVAADIAGPAEWDLPIRDRERGRQAIAALAGPDPGAGFHLAAEALGSSAQRMECNVYDLAPERVGRFDVIVCGSLLLHLRDPVRGLEAIRSVCDGWLLSAETIRIGLTSLLRRLPVAEVRGGTNGQWWIPNAAGHRRLLESAGFEVEQTSRPYAIPFGPGHPRADPQRRLRLERLLTRALLRRPGVPHVAALARPR
jgi:tRNA (mo5U34)-methyltransferase